jgi:HD-like signal output (HDOD) protein
MGRNLFEDLSAGLNHAKIGARIAVKWNFPEILVEAIQYHHAPTECSPEYKDVVYTVYLANSIANIEREGITYDILDHDITRYFGINNKAQFDMLKNKLYEAFEREQQREREAR